MVVAVATAVVVMMDTAVAVTEVAVVMEVVAMGVAAMAKDRLALSPLTGVVIVWVSINHSAVSDSLKLLCYFGPFVE